MTAATVKRGRAADEDVDPQRLTPADRRRVVHADPAVDLVMQPDLAVGLILVARELDPVHPQVRPAQARAVRVLGVDLRQGDKRPAVHRPALDLRQLIDRDPVGQDRPGSHAPRQQPPERARHAAISPGVLGQRARINLELDQPAHRLERVAKQELRPVERAEQVAQERERRPLGPAEQQGRSARLIDPPLDGGDLQVRVDLLVDDDELLLSFQVADAFRQRSITHAAGPSRMPGGATCLLA